MSVIQYFRDLYNKCQGRYVPIQCNGKPVPVCNYCHRGIDGQAIYYRPRRLVFDTEDCKSAMLNGNGSSCEMKDLATLISLAEINALTQPSRGDIAPKRLKK